MATYPALNKALVIDPSGELRDFLRFCAARIWPNLQIASYLWARGCPDEAYDWTGFDLIVLEHRLHNRHEQGIEWLRAIRRNPAAPAIVLISDELTETLRTEAERAGAAAVLNKNDLSPRRFVECLGRVFRVPDPASDSPASPPLPEADGSESPASEGTELHADDSPPDLWLTASDEIAPVQVPGFRIVRPIATMNRGWLSLAVDQCTERSVALKIVRVTEHADPKALRRFKNEYGILSTLVDANVVRVLKQGVVEDCVFIAMEYCTGGTLSERMRRGISTEAAIDYLAQIMRGLRAIHARGILHRDLKPTNLLIRENNTLALTDFGIERDISDNPRLTSARSLVGDLHYVSPESIRDGMVDPRSDLYSAGVIFYHMLTGAVPFKSASITAMLDAHLNAPIPRLPASMAPLQPLINGLLEKDPNERFQSAADVLDGIEWLATASA